MIKIRSLVSRQMRAVSRCNAARRPFATAYHPKSEEASSDGSSSSTEPKEDKEKSVWTVQRFAGVAFTFFGSMYIGFNVYKCNGNINQAESRIIGQMKKMHFYPPPGPTPAELNSRMADTNLEPETTHYLSHYFIHFDNAKPGNGFSREDTLELIDCAGFDENAEPCRDFLARAAGHIEEHRRAKSASLNEVLSLVDWLVKNDAEDGLNKEKKLVEIIMKRLPMLPPFDQALAVKRMWGQFSSETFDDVDASEKEMLETELNGFRNRKQQILSGRRNKDAPLTPAENSRIVIIEKEISDIEGKLKTMM
eukprot:gene767-897_t